MVILLVEDQALLAMALETALSEAGHDVVGPAAFEQLAIELAHRSSPQLALVNIDLAQGGSGIEVARVLQALAIPCIFVSGAREKALAHRELALGMIRKPYDPNVVIASIAAVERILARDCSASPPSDLELF